MSGVVDDLSVVLVSNRGPVSFVEQENGFDVTRGAGGMAGALDPVARRLGHRALWIAAATSDTDKAALAAGAVDDLEEQLGYPVRLLDIDPETYSSYYDVSSNRMLWFAVHCLWDELGIDRFGAAELSAWNAAYEPVNARFARAVLESADADSIILFQDYHLTLAPGFVRRARPSQTILHFTHSSFCGPRGMERLPDPIPQRVIEGMLGANLLGFHVAPWVKGFLDSCETIGATVDRDAGVVIHEDRTTWVREYPIPVDPDDLIERARDDEARSWARRFDAHTAGPLIVRADRTEPSKNIVRGFEAFGALLDRRRDLRGRARFVACLYPSRETMEEYRRYTERIEATVQEVNRRHPDAIELFLEDDYNRTVGALLKYDVLLVNPIMDGMNLVSKEGPTVNERDGVLVLSSGAGSFEELGEAAIPIEDALDVDATAAALERALELPADERSRRAAELRRVIRGHTPSEWIETQLEDLVRIQKGGDPQTAPC
jgi:trehalose 6-phosphate synthase